MIDIKELENRIICADCMDILRQLPDKCVDLVLTDPPYGHALPGAEARRTGGTWSRKYAVRENHARPRAGGWFKKFGADKFTSWDVAPPPEIFAEIFRVSKNQIIWGGQLLCPTAHALL